MDYLKPFLERFDCEEPKQFDTTQLFEEQQLKTLGHLHDLRKELDRVILELEVKYLKIW